MAKHRYLIALGSNMRHHRYGVPERVIAAALAALGKHKLQLEASSASFRTAPLGPSRRRYANAVAIVRTKCEPDALLRRLKTIERKFGRRRGGQRWTARVLDLDIVLWDGGVWRSRELAVPHAAFRDRSFVLLPAVGIAGCWRDPVSGFTVRQLAARLTRPRLVRRGTP